MTDLKDTRIKIAVHSCGVNDPALAWYFRSYATCEFFVPAKNDSYICLLRFFVPRDWTILVPGGHVSGYHLKFQEWMLDYEKVKNLEFSDSNLKKWDVFSEQRDLFTKLIPDVFKTEEEVTTHKKTLLHAWGKLICFLLNAQRGNTIDLLKDGEDEIKFFESYIEEEMKERKGFYLSYKKGLDVFDKTKFPQFLYERKMFKRISECTVEIISYVCKDFLVQINKNQNEYPLLYMGAEKILRDIQNDTVEEIATQLKSKTEETTEKVKMHRKLRL